MKDISAGLPYNNYIGSIKAKNLFKGLPFNVKLKNILHDGQKRGCSGFITNTETGKVCYLSTELFFNGGSGGGLWNNRNKAIVIRTAKDTKDFKGGINVFIPVEKIVETAIELTR